MDEGFATQPRAEEGADLVREQGEAEQGCQIADAEQFADNRGGGRHGGEPGKAQADGEKVENRIGARREQVEDDEDGARGVHPKEQVFAAVMPDAPADEQAAGDVGHADQRK